MVSFASVVTLVGFCGMVHVMWAVIKRELGRKLRWA